MAGRVLTDAQYRERLADVENAMVMGFSDKEIRELLMGKHGVSYVQAWRDIGKVRKEWETQSRKRKREREGRISFEKAIRRREQIYNTSMNAMDMQAALAAEKDRCKLEGMYESTPAPVAIAMVNNDNRIANVDNLDARRARLNDIIATLRKSAEISGPKTIEGEVLE